MPYELGTIWNVTSKYIYNTLDKNIGIGTTTPICELDVYCNIAENGIKLEDKYQLKPENNKKYDLIVREDLNQDHPQLIIWYKFNKDDFTSNFTSNNDNTDTEYRRLIIEGTGTISNLQKEYYVGTGSAEINDELYYKIEMTTNKFSSAEYTFCFWLFLNEECENDRYILNLKDTASVLHTSIFHIKYNTNKLIIYKNYQTKIEYHYTLHKKKWHHISIIINNTIEPIILINGIKLTNYTPTANNIYLRDGVEKQNSADIYLGNTNNSTINGYIDDFRIYQNNLPIAYIQNNIIGKITKITPGNISANGNYGIDIVNYSNLINVGTENSNVDLTIYGDLTVISNFNIDSITINNATFTETTSTNITATTITENNKKLIDKYALIGSIDKNTDIIVSKMIDSDDVNELYDKMPSDFRSKLIISYNFDYDVNDINNSNAFFRNKNVDVNSGWYTYDVIPNKEKANSIYYYGTKYVKGNASLHCYSNVDGIHYYNFRTKAANEETFHRGKNYTISFWIRFNKIKEIQHIFHFGSGNKKINLKLKNDKLVFINTSDSNKKEIIVDDVNFKKDEWYHICIILKNKSNIYVAKDDNDKDHFLINQFKALGYLHHDDGTLDSIEFNNADYDKDGFILPSLFIYINGINYTDQPYAQNEQFFGNAVDTDNFIGVEDDESTTDYLDGFIDDFKIYETIVPIQYINKHIIGDALVIKPGQLSAIGNYGINIKNFENVVSIGQLKTKVNLNIYGLLNVVNDTIQFSNIQIDAIENALSTSNITITNILNTNSNISSNITVSNSIEGDGFILGSSSNLIDNIEITTLSNSNLKSCNITADTITVANELILGDATLSNINIVGINIDDTFSISNNDITIRSNLIIGDNRFNDRRYNLANVNIPSSDHILSTYSTFKEYNKVYRLTYALNIVDSSHNIQVFDKSIIFYGNTNKNHYDIHFKNNYIRDNSCNIRDEIGKSYVKGEDRDRTRIKLDVGNIKLQNGFIELKHSNILQEDEPSILKIEENQISINSNHNTTILNDSLRLSNNDNYCLLTNSNFTFSNSYGFTHDEKLTIKTISASNITGIDDTPCSIVGNLDGGSIINITCNITTSGSLYTSNTLYVSNITGIIDDTPCSIVGNLDGDSIINITGNITTISNITGSNIEASNITGSNIEASNITVNTITVNDKLNVSNIIASNIDCSDTITSSNIICEYEIGFTPDSDSISNTTINKNQIKVNTLQIYGSIILGDQQSSGNNNSINGGFGSLSIQTIRTTNSNSDVLSIDTFYEDSLGKIQGFLYSNSKIDINDYIRTNSNIYCTDLVNSNITSGCIYATNITVDTITVVNDITFSSITASTIDCSDKITSSNINSSNVTVSNILFASNIQGIDDTPCSIVGNLNGGSIINITCNITTSGSLYTSNTLYVSNIQGIDDTPCSIVGNLDGGSIINITCNITTSGSLYTSNTLYVSNIQGIDDTPCSIVGSLNGDSIIDINGDIKTLTNIRGNHLYINNIYSKNSGNEIIFNNDTVNSNVTRCIELKVEQISSFDSIDKIKIYNDIIIENEQYGEKEPFVILTSANIIIKDNDQNTEFKFETNKISYNGNDKNTNIIEIDSSSDVTINCDILNVTQIDFESDQFEFDKIITYTRKANSDPDKQWPNVYIGFNTEFEKRQADRDDNNYLDVLYVDTPDNSRLKTGNILIQKELTIDDEDDSTVNFKIITKNSYTYFKNHNNFDLLVFSLKNKSIGINTKPPDIDNIKLFVKDGGIQTTGDIIAFANISDKRFKMNITPFNTNDGIDIINKLNPVKFRWKADLFNTTMANKDDIGFIAQEVAEIIPEAVAKCKIEMNDIDYNYINYERIIPYLVNNIKYLNNKIVELEDKLNGI